jgi:hypothetical protein
MSERRADENAKRETNNLKRSHDKVAMKELQSNFSASKSERELD